MIKFKLENETNEDGMSYKYYFDKMKLTYGCIIGDSEDNNYKKSRALYRLTDDRGKVIKML